MRIHVTSVMVDDQDKALKFYTEVLGFVKKNDIPVGEYRWLTVVSPEGPQDVEPPVILLPLGAFYCASAVYDRMRHGRIHPVSLWGGVLLLTFAIVRAALIGPSAAWHAIAGRLVN